jgi:hypothetical protein
LRYAGPRYSPDGKPLGEVPIINLVPAGYSLSDPDNAEGCRDEARDLLLSFVRGNPEVTRLGKRVWLDLEQGVMGSETAKEYYFFRYICLPMSTVDDLDMFGTQYREFYIQDPPGKQAKPTIGIHYKGEDILNLAWHSEETKVFNENATKGHKELVAKGYATIVQSDDVRIHFWYDPDRFFKRFEKYGISAKIQMPDTKKGVDTWQDSSWNTRFKVLPLGQATELDTAKKQSESGDHENAQKYYNNLKYKTKIPIWVTP